MLISHKHIGFSEILLAYLALHLPLPPIQGSLKNVLKMKDKTIKNLIACDSGNKTKEFCAKSYFSVCVYEAAETDQYN